MKPKQRILITGGSGLLGINWALANRDFYSVTLGLNKREVLLAGVESRWINLVSVDSFLLDLEAVCPHLVVHTAGITSVEECEANPGLAYYANVELSANVALACARFGIPLVHISTDHLFKGDIPMVGETHPVSPINTYGRTKAEAELRVLEANSKTLVIRTNFYGWGTTYRHSFSDKIIAALEAGLQTTLFKDVFYTPILISEMVLAVQELVRLNTFGIFHLVGDGRITKYDFGVMIADEFGLDSNLIAPGLFANQSKLIQRPYDMSLSNQKICKVLNRTLGGPRMHVASLRNQRRQSFSETFRAINNTSPKES